MKLWCRDMALKELPLLIYRDLSGALCCFLFYRQVELGHIELLLGGSLPGKGLLTPLFWASFLEYFQHIGVKSITTNISASNIVIANIYFMFDFIIKDTLFDFHKIVFPK
jgi:hypothetical protein